jgi:hypothetical protein
MKKIYFSLLVIIVASIIGITGCKKNQEAIPDTGVVSLTAEGLAKDESFIKLNNAISRFDPQYLVLVYKDKRTIKEITERSNELLTQLSTSPESILYQKQLADFYHFASVDQLKQYSASITESLKKIDAKYNFQKTLFSGNGGQLYYKARGLYAKDQVYAIQNADKGVRTNGLWLDLVESELSSFENYNNVVYDESLEDGGESGGGDGCNGEKCCYARRICLEEARNEFLRNLVYYGGGGALVGGAGGAKIGGTAGTLIVGPSGTFFGTVIGTLWGGVAIGGLGATIAYNIYSGSKNICTIKYNECMSKPK